MRSQSAAHLASQLHFNVSCLFGWTGSLCCGAPALMHWRHLYSTALNKPGPCFCISSPLPRQASLLAPALQPLLAAAVAAGITSRQTLLRCLSCLLS